MSNTEGIATHGEKVILRDGFGRVHDYLRISLIDKCNLRCTYCMPENIRFLPREELLTADEIGRIARTFVEDYGVTRIRLTGGEPLIRPDAGEIIRDLGSLPADLTVTTNALRLHEFWDVFREAGIHTLNISLDSLRQDRFAAITRRDGFREVWRNVREALDRGLRVKLNMVVMRDVNDDELTDFAALSREENLHVRFIEFMPFDGNGWQHEKVLSYADILARIGERYSIRKLNDKPHSTSKGWQIEGFAGTFAVISTVTAPFCSECNRIRLTAEGKLRNCLFAREETDLRAALREGRDIREMIEASIRSKAARLGGLPQFQDEDALREELSPRAMVRIGG